MIGSDEEQGRDLSRLVVPRAGRLVTMCDACEPYRIVGPSGEVVESVSVFLRDLVNGQVFVPAGGQVKVPAPRVDQVLFKVVPPLARASRMR